MPKIYEYACLDCNDWNDEDTVQEIFLGNLEQPEDNLELDCKKCGNKSLHIRIPFNRFKGGLTQDGSPYKGHCLG